MTTTVRFFAVVPSDDPSNRWAAGYEANVFPTEGAAELGVESLEKTCPLEEGLHWIVREFVGPVCDCTRSWGTRTCHYCQRVIQPQPDGRLLAPEAR